MNPVRNSPDRENLMHPRPISPAISVATQLTPAAIAAAKAAGFRTVINNRPDHEEAGQPTSAELEAKSKAEGLEYHHIPVVPGRFTDAQADAFGKLLDSSEKPVLAFCKSGMRATTLWALSQAGKLTADEILRQAAACGYDLRPLRGQIEARARLGRRDA